MNKKGKDIINQGIGNFHLPPDTGVIKVLLEESEKLIYIAVKTMKEV